MNISSPVGQKMTYIIQTVMRSVELAYLVAEKSRQGAGKYASFATYFSE